MAMRRTKTRPGVLLLFVIGGGVLVGCGGSSPTDYPPLKDDLDAGLEVWEVQITSPGSDGEPSEASNRITRYIVLEAGKVIRHYVSNASGGDASWQEETARENVTITGGKEANGTIKVDQTTSTTVLGDMHLTFTIEGKAIKGEITIKSRALDVSGTAKKISP